MHVRKDCQGHREHVAAEPSKEVGREHSRTRHLAHRVGMHGLPIASLLCMMCAGVDAGRSMPIVSVCLSVIASIFVVMLLTAPGSNVTALILTVLLGLFGGKLQDLYAAESARRLGQSSSLDVAHWCVRGHFSLRVHGVYAAVSPTRRVVLRALVVLLLCE
jgi:hypothetical protein